MAGDSARAGHRPPAPVPSDHDRYPDRMQLAPSMLRRHGVAGDVRGFVARRFIAEGFSRVLDVGCGEGGLARDGEQTRSGEHPRGSHDRLYLYPRL